jgi:hypothetical protein
VLDRTLRAIIHLDLDCFYAQVEAVRLGIDLDAPFCVTQWGALLAVSYSARAAGVGRMDHITEARRKCPALMHCHTATYAAGDTEPHHYPEHEVNRGTHKVSLDVYRAASKRIFAVLQRFRPDALEKGGTDEAFMDVSSLAWARLARERVAAAASSSSSFATASTAHTDFAVSSGTAGSDSTGKIDEAAASTIASSEVTAADAAMMLGRAASAGTTIVTRDVVIARYEKEMASASAAADDGGGSGGSSDEDDGAEDRAVARSMRTVPATSSPNGGINASSGGTGWAIRVAPRAAVESSSRGHVGRTAEGRRCLHGATLRSSTA